MLASRRTWAGLFGLANQVALFLLAAESLTLLVLGYRAWWQQLPLRFVIPAPLVLIATGWAIPLFVLSLLGFLCPRWADRPDRERAGGRIAV